MKTKAFPIAWKRLFDYNKLIHRMHHVCLQTGDAFYERSTGTKDIYRAVSPEEFDDIFATGGFRARPDGRSFQAKEFGNSFDETLEFANKPINLDKAAIVKVTIPENVYNQLHHMNLDRAIFKSGTPVVEPEMLDMFNESIISIEHAF